MTDPMAATPGWVDTRLDTIFRDLPVSARPAADAFAECLAGSKAPAAPSDNLGAEFSRCHTLFRQALLKTDLAEPARADILSQLQALEAEIAADS